MHTPAEEPLSPEVPPSLVQTRSCIHSIHVTPKLGAEGAGELLAQQVGQLWGRARTGRISAFGES